MQSHSLNVKAVIGGSICLWPYARSAYLAFMMRNVWTGAVMALVAVVVFNVLGILGHELALWESILIVVGVGVVFGLVAGLIRYLTMRVRGGDTPDD
jgi:hypothetical protein